MDDTDVARRAMTSTPVTSTPCSSHPHVRPSPAPSAATKVYGTGDQAVRALDDVTVEIPGGRFTAIMGPSGSGKSTLMHCLAGLDTLTSGQVFLGETELGLLSDRELTALRRERVGFVFQSFNLMPTLTAWENITLPFALAGHKADAESEWLDVVIRTVGLGDRLRHRPSELSGGQQQRVADRAGVGDPARPRVRRRADRQPRLARPAPRCSSSCAPRCATWARPS